MFFPREVFWVFFLLEGLHLHIVKTQLSVYYMEN